MPILIMRSPKEPMFEITYTYPARMLAARIVHILDRSIDVGDLSPDPLGAFVIATGFHGREHVEVVLALLGEPRTLSLDLLLNSAFLAKAFLLLPFPGAFLRHLLQVVGRQFELTQSSRW